MSYNTNKRETGVGEGMRTDICTFINKKRGESDVKLKREGRAQPWEGVGLKYYLFQSISGSDRVGIETTQNRNILCRFTLCTDYGEYF